MNKILLTASASVLMTDTAYAQMGGGRGGRGGGMMGGYWGWGMGHGWGFWITIAILVFVVAYQMKRK
jgi:uncharacterized membrane protein